jgi:hypothetical protein
MLLPARFAVRRMRVTSTGPTQVTDPDGSSVSYTRGAPRCYAPMQGYESIWGALLDGVKCGRPAGHNGKHRSVQSLDKERNKRRWEQYSEKRQQKRRRAKLARALREIDGYRRSGS